MSPKIFATVGTDTHPFDRMVQWMDDVASMMGADVFIQYGTSQKPLVAQGVDYLGHGELGELMSNASVVITHGGPATIMEARSRHGSPIVMPRDPLLGEHIDSHQQEFCTFMAAKGAVVLATTADCLLASVEQHLASPPQPPIGDGAIPDGVRNFSEHLDSLLGGARSARPGVAKPR